MTIFFSFLQHPFSFSRERLHIHAIILFQLCYPIHTSASSKAPSSSCAPLLTSMRTSVHPRTLRSIVDDLQMHVTRASAIRQLRDDVNVLFCGRDERHHVSSCEDLRPFLFKERKHLLPSAVLLLDSVSLLKDFMMGSILMHFLSRP